MRSGESSSGRKTQVMRTAAPTVASVQKDRSIRVNRRDGLPLSAFGSIIGFGLSLERVAQLSRALPGVPVVSTSSVHEFESRIAQLGACTVLCSVPAAAYTDRLADLTSIVSRYSQSVWIALYEEGESDLSAVNALAKAGVTDTIRAVRLADPESLRLLLSRLAPQASVDRILSELDLDLHPDLVELLRLALSRAHTPLTVAQLADARRVHERSLRKLCEQGGLPSPQWIVGWARCLMVAYYLQDAGRSIQSAAKLLGFSSPASMANHLRRYTGKTAKVLRKEGSLRATARALETALPDNRCVSTAAHERLY